MEVKEGTTMKIAMANDHAGTALKNQIKEWLEAQGHEVVDFGTYDEEGCDLSDFVYPAALAVSKGECERGIFVDGVGYGSAMIAPTSCAASSPVCARTRCARSWRASTTTRTSCASAGRSSAASWRCALSKSG